MKVVRKFRKLKNKKSLGMKPKAKYSFQLVKWDGEAPSNWKEISNPEQHPQCAEVIEWQLGQEPNTKYKKE